MKYFLIFTISSLISFFSFFSNQKDFFFLGLVLCLIVFLCTLLFSNYLINHKISHSKNKSKSKNLIWSLFIIIGISIGYMVSSISAEIQKHNNQEIAKRFVEKVEIYKKINGHYPKDSKSLINEEYTIPPKIQLGFQAYEIDYYIKYGVYYVEYKCGDLVFNKYSSETNKWTIYIDDEWAIT